MVLYFAANSVKYFVEKGVLEIYLPCKMEYHTPVLIFQMFYTSDRSIVGQICANDPQGYRSPVRNKYRSNTMYGWIVANMYYRCVGIWII